MEQWEWVEECSACGYGPVRAVKYCETSGYRKGETFWLCNVCYSSPGIGLVTRSESTDIVRNGTVIRMLAICTNMILKKLEEK